MPSATRMPAEWEPQQAIWLALPHDQREWGVHFSQALASVTQLANTIAETQPVNLLVFNQAHTLELHENVTCHAVPYGDIWLRDIGPLFIEREGAKAASTFAFNGWGQKYLFAHDDTVAVDIARLATVPYYQSPLVAEGGALDCNGNGTFLSTKECLLNANRNPKLDQAAVESALAEALGARHVIWLERGLAGDHTDGHVDNLARFVDEMTVVCMQARSNDDPNAVVLGEVLATLATATTADGQPLNVVTLPSPGLLPGPLMAASYCNFLITNTLVIVPTFGSVNDAEALASIARLFPTRRVVAHDSRALLTGGGTVHCISQQEPRYD